MISIFTRVVTAIFLIASIYIALFSGAQQVLSIKDIWAVMLIGAVSAVFYLPFLLDVNYSKTLMVIMQLVYFLVINAVTLCTGYLRSWFSLKSPLNVLSFEVVVISVYAIVMIVSYKIDSASAKKMNEKLEERSRN